MEKWPFRFKLTKEERAIEREIHKYVPVPKAEFDEIVRAIARRRKEAVLSIRINQQDLDNLKKKAKQFKVPYQSFIAEILHRHAT
jgi:predicted DNA binding CopG/RHH family protein